MSDLNSTLFNDQVDVPIYKHLKGIKYILESLEIPSLPTVYQPFTPATI